MIQITTVRRAINFTVQQLKPIAITVGGKAVSFTVANRKITFVIGQRNTYLHTITLLDVGNKFVEASYLQNVSDLSMVQVWIDSSMVKLSYLDDYAIQNGRIIWAGLDAEQLFKPGRKLRVYF